MKNKLKVLGVFLMLLLIIPQYGEGGSWTTIKSWSSSKEGTNHGFTKDWYVTSGLSK